MKSQSLFRVFVIFAMSCFMGVLSFVSGQIPAPTQATGSQNQNYRIGPGDVIDVTVSQNTQLTKTGVRVSNQGTVQLSMLDEEVQAGCKTERELADLLKEKYKKYLLNPYIIVTVQQFNSTPVAVIGAVNAPGRFQLQRPVRLNEMLAWVGGTAERAGSTVEIVRNRSLPVCDGSQFLLTGGTGDELISLNLTDTMKGAEGSNPYVRAGDIIRIADADIKKAYVVGNVKSAMAIPLKEPVTLTQAIAMAGGLAQGAQQEKVVIRRQMNGAVNRTEMIANLKEINLQTKDDILLQSNDIVEVPGPKRTFLGDLYRIMLPMAASLPLAAIP